METRISSARSRSFRLKFLVSGLPGLLVFVGGNLERTWNELRRECFCEATKMAGVTAGNEKIYDAMWGTKIVHTAVHTIVHTGVHTQ